MLDSNTCAFIMNERHGVVERFRQALPHGICVSSIVLSELEYGVRKSAAQARNRNKLNGLCSLLSVFPYDTQATTEYGIIRSELERRGQVIGSLDMLIAAHAKSLSLTLVSNNISEFLRVDGLTLEDWVL
jgi:tRNA(fMet)-specific endonuclease VapC